MSILPTDLSSFIWGAAIGLVGAFGTGFFKKAGESFFAFIANKIHPKPLEPIQVGGSFVAEIYSPGQCAWVSETSLYEYEQKGYTYYPHPKNKARCYRMYPDGRLLLKEFLMVQPNATKLNA
mgnify:CR=1 FL=1